MDAVTPTTAQTADAHSHLVRPTAWSGEDPVSGCEAKKSLFDRKTGLMTALMRFRRGGVARPRARQHPADLRPRRLARRQGRPGAGYRMQGREFIWRRQPPCGLASQGGLMLTLFQVPDKFFEADGRVIDAAGEDWDEILGGGTRKS